MAARLTPMPEDQQFLRRLFLILLVFGLLVFLYKITDLLLLAFGSAMGAVLLSAIADWVAAKTRLHRGGGLAIAVLLLFGALGLIGWLFGTELGSQYAALTARLPADWARVQAELSDGPLGRMLLGGLQNVVKGASVANWAVGAGLGAGEIVVNFLIVLVGSLFFAAQPQLYRRGAILLAPPRYRPVVADALDDAERTLRLWLLTQVVLMTTMGLLVGLGLWISGVPSAAALGLLAGLSEFIPYVGPTLAMVPALVIAAAGGGSIAGTIMTYVGVRAIQSNFITPMVQRHVVSVPPAVTLFVIMAFGYAFGTFGLFFSAALLVVAYTLVGRLYLRETLGDDIRLPGEPED